MQKGKRVQPTPKTTRERGGEKRSAKKKVTPVGLTVITLMTVLTVVFAIILAVAQLLPAKFLLLIYVALLLVLAVIALLVKNHKKRKPFTVGLVVSAVMAVALVIGGLTIGRGILTLNAITNGEVEIDYISVYVRNDNAAEKLVDTVQYKYGILESTNREVTNQALDQLNKKLKTEIKTEEFTSITDLLDALLGGTVDAILLPDAFLPLIGELRGYEDAASQMRSLITLELKSEGEMEKTPKSPNSFAVLISGIDTWGYVNAVSRSDVNILAVVNTDTKQVLLLSTPRDYYVPLSISDGVCDKLTHAGIYGIDVSMDTIGMIYDIDVDYFFRVNFSGFEEIIDSLGGVTVYSEYAFKASTTGEWFSAGENYLDGESALAFARERYSFKEGDRERGRNQMKVVQAVINKALSPELLKNFTGVMEAVEGNFQTSVPYEKITSVVRDQLNDGGEWNIVTYSVNGTEDTQCTYSMNQPLYVIIPDEATIDTAKELIRQVYEDEIVALP